jgi:two-component system, NarL family, nitrate/nitrite response regulator NarL
VKALICDDHTVFADSLAHLLSTSGIDVVGVAYTPQAAIDALAETQVDVCSLDVMFGDDSVLDRLVEIRRTSSRTHFMLLTGLLEAAAVRAGRAAGVLGFAEKKQSAADIIATFHKVAAGQLVVPSSFRRIPVPRQALSESAQAARRLASYLTPRERQVLSALVGGVDTTGLSRHLGITTATARCHIQSLLIKMNVHSRVEAATTAVRLGLLDPETGDWWL